MVLKRVQSYSGARAVASEPRHVDFLCISGFRIAVIEPRFARGSPPASGMTEIPCLSGPELACRFDNQGKFSALIVLGDRIAGNGAGESALRADGQPVHVDVTV